MNSEGAMPLTPKDACANMMISAFAPRELGYGTEISGYELCKVNEYCKNKSYSDKLAATNRACNATKIHLPLRRLNLSLNMEVMAKVIRITRQCLCTLKIVLIVCLLCILFTK